MGIINPRPSMRAAEERRLRNTLKQHQALRVEIRESGVSDEEASSIAFNIVTSHVQRKKIWRTK